MARRMRAAFPIFAVTVVLCALAAVALAARPNQVKGGSYNGGLLPASRGVRVSFKVSRDGRTVTFLRITNTPLYCEGGGAATPVHFKNAPISSSGRFTSTGRYVIKVGPLKGEVGTRLQITGRFLDARREQGTLTTTYLKAPKCSGRSSYATKA